MKSILMAAAGLALFSTTALAQTSSDQEFVAKAASSGMYEIQSSQMIMQDPSATADVKTFAQQIISDHEKAAADLKQAAMKSDIAVPMELTAEDQQMLEQLTAADNKVPTYLNQQVKAHQKALALHQGYGSAGKDANLKTYADATTPVLEMHAMHVQKLLDTDATATSSTSGGTTAPAN
ncbi:DUF4142 domain-containing protein [Mangrovicella endophytica]|uniref:DUF4142 domain-containing protein n=1 Tax=Mangrovicella endophytica TaxID=2066697 RepID=UPI0013001582|nr:DUF4142 domain-containing protein [Mangrovicella endophytica]